MPVEERIVQLEHLLSLRPGGARSSEYDHPQFWLALLYQDRGDLEKAIASLESLLEKNHVDSLLWLQLYAQLLEQLGGNLEKLAQTRAAIARQQSKQ